MKKLYQILSIFFIGILVTLAINLTANWQYYMDGGDWKSSIFFSLGCATLCAAAGIGLFEFSLKNFDKWKKHPVKLIFLSLLYSSVVSFACVVLMLKMMVWFWGWQEQSTSSYIISGQYAVIISGFITMMVIGFKFLRQLQKTSREKEAIEHEMELSKYEVLKNQVNPHFLFNSLNTLSSLVHENPDTAVDFIQKMSKVFRYSLQHADQNTVDLKTEMDICHAYIFINQQRFNDKLTVSNTVDKNLEAKIVTQSLLMVLENAIKHNEISAEHPLHISITNDGQYLVVSNNNQPKKVIDASTGIGQENIVNRYKLVSALPVVILNTPQSYTVKLPLL
ncbi:MAG: histidine kinase [Bacteroidetes bacterium]|nr:histidine kinase [Bacteroidota bacterium]